MSVEPETNQHGRVRGPFQFKSDDAPMQRIKGPDPDRDRMAEARADAMVERLGAEKYLADLWSLLPLGVQAHIMRLRPQGLDPVFAALRAAQSSEVERERDMLRATLGISEGTPQDIIHAAVAMNDGSENALRLLRHVIAQGERAEKAESEVERLMSERCSLRRDLAREENTIDQRDRAQNMADELAERIVSLTVGGDSIEAIGEHTSANDPWQRAIELADEHLASPPAPSGWQQRIAAMDPWDDDDRSLSACIFCQVLRYKALRDGGGSNAHKPDCLWQNAKDALS